MGIQNARTTLPNTHRMRKPVLFTFFCSFLFFLTACGPTSIARKPVLISSSQIVYYNNSVLELLTTNNDSLVYQPADYEVSINRITYQTTLDDGTPITASGIVYVPNQLSTPKKAYPLLSLQHPTAYTDAEVPSGSDFTAPNFTYPLYFATHGYIVACPDYIGYGLTDKIPHNYEHRQTLAQATVDMLLATKEFLKYNDYYLDKQGIFSGLFGRRFCYLIRSETAGRCLPG